MYDLQTHLTPNQHGAEDDLQSVKEVVSNDDDSSTSCCPAFTGTNGFDTRCSCFQKCHRTNLEEGEKKKTLIICTIAIQHSHYLTTIRSFAENFQSFRINISVGVADFRVKGVIRMEFISWALREVLTPPSLLFQGQCRKPKTHKCHQENSHSWIQLRVPYHTLWKSVGGFHSSHSTH